jgi:hypothetical protein
LLVGKQLGFSDYEQSTSIQRNKRENFLAEIEQVVPSQALLALIEPWYPKSSKKGAVLPIHFFRCCGSPYAAVVQSQRFRHGMGAD